MPTPPPPPPPPVIQRIRDGAKFTRMADGTQRLTLTYHVSGIPCSTTPSAGHDPLYAATFATGVDEDGNPAAVPQWGKQIDYPLLWSVVPAEYEAEWLPQSQDTIRVSIVCYRKVVSPELIGISVNGTGVHGKISYDEHGLILIPYKRGHGATFTTAELTTDATVEKDYASVDRLFPGAVVDWHWRVQESYPIFQRNRELQGCANDAPFMGAPPGEWVCLGITGSVRTLSPVPTTPGGKVYPLSEWDMHVRAEWRGGAVNDGSADIPVMRGGQSWDQLVLFRDYRHGKVPADVNPVAQGFGTAATTSGNGWKVTKAPRGNFGLLNLPEFG